MVAMNSVIGGWLTSGRSTTRSMAIPMPTMITSVASRLPQNGRPMACRLTKVSAANSTSAPWAKLNTPDAL